MSVAIRQATNADIDAVVRVIKAVYDEYAFSWDPERYHADLYDLERYYAPPDQFFVAETTAGVVGTVALEVFETISGEPGTTALKEGFVRAAGADCSLERLYVHPDGRRGGVGHALTQHVVGQARQQGRHVMELWSDKRFVDAHRLYGRFGAQVIGERICDDPDESPEWGLIIRL